MSDRLLNFLAGHIVAPAYALQLLFSCYPRIAAMARHDVHCGFCQKRTLLVLMNVVRKCDERLLAGAPKIWL